MTTNFHFNYSSHWPSILSSRQLCSMFEFTLDFVISSSTLWWISRFCFVVFVICLPFLKFVSSLFSIIINIFRNETTLRVSLILFDFNSFVFPKSRRTVVFDFQYHSDIPYFNDPKNRQKKWTCAFQNGLKLESNFFLIRVCRFSGRWISWSYQNRFLLPHYNWTATFYAWSTLWTIAKIQKNLCKLSKNV